MVKEHMKNVRTLAVLGFVQLSIGGIPLSSFPQGVTMQYMHRPLYRMKDGTCTVSQRIAMAVTLHSICNAQSYGHPGHCLNDIDLPTWIYYFFGRLLLSFIGLFVSHTVDLSWI
ncbi:hypothetical protein BDQ17DRAFT_1381245 [Cyathus striatus]|nr:hypothetical protein BDQ17DRAFT_1381245 [Cyathus striatus]